MRQRAPNERGGVPGRLALAAALFALAGCGAAAKERPQNAEPRPLDAVAQVVECAGASCDLIVDCSAVVREGVPYNRCVVDLADLAAFGCETAPDDVRCADADGAGRHLLDACCPL